MNILCTAGIAIRLWSIAFSNDFAVAGSYRDTSRYVHAIIFVMESGAIFSAFSIVTIVSYIFSHAKLETKSELTGGAILQAAFNVNVQIALLAPLLILVRAHFGVSSGIGQGRKEIWKSKGNSTFASPKSRVRSSPLDGESVQLDVFSKQSTDGGLQVLYNREVETYISPPDSHRLTDNISGEADSMIFISKTDRQSDAESNITKYK